jgi:hypothetical protein
MLLDRLHVPTQQDVIRRQLLAYVGSHAAFGRTMAQLFLCKHRTGLSEAEQTLLAPYFQYVQEDRNAIKIAEKVSQELDKMNVLLNSTITG